MERLSRRDRHFRHFCYCMSLICGVRVITAVTLVMGSSFVILTSILNSVNHYEVITFSCLVSATMFFIWFLTLLLLQGLDKNWQVPMKLATLLCQILIAWLLLKIGLLFYFLAIIKPPLKAYMEAAMWTSITAIIFNLYSLWILKSYSSLNLEIEEVQNDPSQPSVINVPSSLLASDVSALNNPSSVPSILRRDTTSDGNISIIFGSNSNTMDENTTNSSPVSYHKI